MHLPVRDLDVVRLVAAFGQVTAKHINTAVFGGKAARTSCNRTIARLIKYDLIAPLPLTVGSNEKVYVLGDEGKRQQKVATRYRQTVNFHSLAIADSYCAFVELEQFGRLRITDYLVDRAAREMVGGVDVRPDMRLEIVRWDSQGNERQVPIWLEVDMGTELSRQLRRKLDDYVRARATGKLKLFPIVIWVVPDAKRHHQLQGLIQASAQPDIFKVVMVKAMGTLFP